MERINLTTPEGRAAWERLSGERAKAKPRATHRSPEGMNATEIAYARDLEARRLAKEILGWAYEPVTLQLAPNTTYTPDFLVVRQGGLSFVEIKGKLEDDASVKFKVARELLPWATWSMLRHTKTGWRRVRI